MTQEERFVKKYGDNEVGYDIPTIRDASPFSSGSNGYLTKVRVRNNKFEFYHDWWAWLTIEEIEKEYPSVSCELNGAVISLI